MKNMEKILDMFMDGSQLLHRLQELLRCRDGEFRLLEEACLKAAEESEPLLTLRNRQLIGDLRFALWQGMKLNLQNFHSPVGTATLTLDYTLLLREHIMVTLPEHRRLQAEIDALVGAMPAEACGVLEPVDEYYAYLETVGLKAAHYLGFRLGDVLFPTVEPGYVADAAATQCCRAELEQYIGFPIE